MTIDEKINNTQSMLNRNAFKAFAFAMTPIIVGLTLSYLLQDYFPKYAGYESKSGNIPITIQGVITEGPYAGKTIDEAFYEKTKTYICSKLCSND